MVLVGFFFCRIHRIFYIENHFTYNEDNFISPFPNGAFYYRVLHYYPERDVRAKRKVQTEAERSLSHWLALTCASKTGNYMEPEKKTDKKEQTE